MVCVRQRMGSRYPKGSLCASTSASHPRLTDTGKLCLFSNTLFSSQTSSNILQSLCPSLQLSRSLWWTCVDVRPAWRWVGNGFRRSRDSLCLSPLKITSNTSDWHESSQLGVQGHKPDQQKDGWKEFIRRSKGGLSDGGMFTLRGPKLSEGWIQKEGRIKVGG